MIWLYDHGQYSTFTGHRVPPYRDIKLYISCQHQCYEGNRVSDFLRDRSLFTGRRRGGGGVATKWKNSAPLKTGFTVQRLSPLKVFCDKTTPKPFVSPSSIGNTFFTPPPPHNYFVGIKLYFLLLFVYSFYLSWENNLA